ncbi:MAG TPA: hypothetical protein VLT45_27300 [Kofleriaceae bacterium]|nr:hypothetical protein [Kofleriaceae bacterium]
MKYVIEDDFHAEWVDQHATYEAALARLRQIAATPWRVAPNVTPCSTPECQRTYHLIEYDDTTTPWTRVRGELALKVSAAGVEWAPGFAPN